MRGDRRGPGACRAARQIEDRKRPRRGRSHRTRRARKQDCRDNAQTVAAEQRGRSLQRSVGESDGMQAMDCLRQADQTATASRHPCASATARPDGRGRRTPKEAPRVRRISQANEVTQENLRIKFFSMYFGARLYRLISIRVIAFPGADEKSNNPAARKNTSRSPTAAGRRSAPLRR